MRTLSSDKAVKEIISHPNSTTITQIAENVYDVTFLVTKSKCQSGTYRPLFRSGSLEFYGPALNMTLTPFALTAGEISGIVIGILAGVFIHLLIFGLRKNARNHDAFKEEHQATRVRTGAAGNPVEGKRILAREEKFCNEHEYGQIFYTVGKPLAASLACEEKGPFLHCQCSALSS